MDSIMALFWSRSNMQFAVDKTEALLNTPAVETGLHNIRLTVQTCLITQHYSCNKIKRWVRHDI